MRHAPETLSEERRTRLSNAKSTSDLKQCASRKRFRPVAAVLLVGLTSLLLMQGLFARGGSVSATTESIFTSAANCTDPQPNNSWNLGGTICATATGAPPPANGFRQRRFQWVAPNGSVAQQTDVTASPQNDTYTVPMSGGFAQLGTWRVQTVDNDGGIVSEARFTLRDPANARCDLSINKFGPIKAAAGSNITYTVTVTNQGPDDAQGVVLTDTAPANTTFVSETQVSGPAFDCPGDTPPCSLSTLAVGATATFSLTYNVTAGTPADTIISNTASVSSTTVELFQPDNSSSFETTVTSASTTCTINCPSGITRNNDANQCSAVVTYSTPTTSGTCGSPPDSDVTCDPPSGSAFPVGATIVNCGTQSGGLCSFTVTVNDTRTPVLPTISCPGNVTANEDSPGSGSARVNYAAPTTTGNCVTTVCNPPSGSRFAFGTTPVNCTAQDSANNTVSCSFTVTVTGSTCFLNCPDDMTVNSSPGSGSATVNYSTPTTVGSCPSVTIACNPASGSSFPVGITQVNCTATDQSTVVATCSFIVTVNGSSACSIFCPPNITVSENPSGSGSATVNYPPPTSSGNCSPVLCNPPSGSSFPIGTTTVFCSATDPQGNGASCSFTVTVTGGTPCTITCPSVSPQPSDPGGCTKVVTYDAPLTTGSCGGNPGDPNHVPPIPPTPPNVTCNPPSGSVFPVGTTTVICSTDLGTQCSFPVTITGTDTVAPVITTCAGPLFVLADSSCQAPLPNMTTDVEATDLCTPAALLTITQNPLPGTIVGTGSTTVTLTVKDANNNSTTCTTTFVLFEPTPPTALCKPYTAVLDATGHASITAANVDNGSTDNCAIATRTVTPSTFTCANKGSNTVTLTVTDPSGNSASCQTTVTVVDLTPPTIICPANITKSNDPGQCSAVVTYANATATDNCSGVGIPVCTPASGSTFQKGTTTVTCIVSDASGNSSSCMFTVTVNDTQPPTIACLADIIADFDPAVNGAVVTYATPVGTDNCPGATTSQIAGLPSGGTFPAGTTTNTFKVTDAVGLTAQCSFKVTVALTSLIGLDSVSITGQGLVDSYNSSGGYPATKGSLANVLSNGTITVSGSAKVFGNVRSTRAGVTVSGTGQVTGNATAGTTVSVIPSGVVGGTITNNQLAPVMTVPSVPACGPPYSPNSGITGTYSYNSGTGDLSLSGNNIATLANGTYCFHNVTLTNSAQLKVNGPVVIKLTGTLSASGATSLTNTTAIPGNLRILSSFSGSNGVTLSNGTNAYLVIYAPNTGVTISGSAPLFGTVAGKTLTISNSGMIHYDTQLKSIWPALWSLIQ